MKKMENLFKKYIDNGEEIPYQFAKRSGMSPATIHRIYHGIVKPYYRTAKRICRYTNGKLTLKDFGYIDYDE